MPYKISPHGIRVEFSKGPVWYNLTNYQQKVLAYLSITLEEGNTNYLPSHDIAQGLKLHPRAVSGIAYSLYKKNMVEKLEA